MAHVGELNTASEITAMEYPFAVISVDVGGTKIAAGLVCYGEAGAPPTLRLRESVPTDASRGGEAVLERIAALVQSVAEQAKQEDARVLGVGIATAGRVSAHDGSIAYANEIMPGWTGRPVAARVHAACAMPVAVLNDVQGHALGEARWGAARGARTCLMVAAGTGLGGAVITDGRVLRGKHGFAGEIGNVRCMVSGEPVGVEGTCAVLESVASGSGIEACYAAAGGQRLSGAEVSARAAAGESLAQRVIAQAGQCLGDAVASLANVLDPELVVLSGSVPKAGAAWRAAVQEGFETQMNAAQRDLPIVPAILGDDAPLVGAAENLLDSLVATF